MRCAGQWLLFVRLLACPLSFFQSSPSLCFWLFFLSLLTIIIISIVFFVCFHLMFQLVVCVYVYVYPLRVVRHPLHIAIVSVAIALFVISMQVQLAWVWIDCVNFFFLILFNIERRIRTLQHLLNLIFTCNFVAGLISNHFAHNQTLQRKKCKKNVFIHWLLTVKWFRKWILV